LFDASKLNRRSGIRGNTHNNVISWINIEPGHVLQHYHTNMILSHDYINMADCNWSSGAESQINSNWNTFSWSWFQMGAPPLKPPTRSNSTWAWNSFPIQIPGYGTNQDLDYEEEKEKVKTTPMMESKIRIAVIPFQTPASEHNISNPFLILHSEIKKTRTFLVLWLCSAMWSECLLLGGFGLHWISRTLIRITSKSSSLSPHRLVHLYCSLLNDS